MNNKSFWEAMLELTPALFKTYVAINKLSDNEIGYCFATNDSIAKKLNKHEKSISRDISELIEKGYLFSNTIKNGFTVVERRLYTAENIKTYMIDKKNIERLIKTKIKIVDEITYYYNEKSENITSNENVTGEIAGNNFEDCTGNKNEEGAGNKIVTLTNTNNTITNTTTTKENNINNLDTENSSSSDSFLKKYLDLATEQNVLSIKPEITEKEFKELWDKCALEVEQGFGKNKNAILIQALKGKWSFQARMDKKKVTGATAEERAIKNAVNNTIAYYECFHTTGYTITEAVNRYIAECKGYENIEMIDNYKQILIKHLKEVG